MSVKGDHRAVGLVRVLGVEMCYVVSGDVLVGFPTREPAIAEIGYGILEEYEAEPLSAIVAAFHHDLKGPLPTEVGRIGVEPGTEQAMIAELNQRITYRAMEVLDHTADPRVRTGLINAFHRTSPPPFQVEPNLPLTSAQPPAGHSFVLDAQHQADARAMLGLTTATGGGQGVHVAIVDSGIDGGQLTPKHALNILDWKDPVLKWDVSDGVGHGTQMASILAAEAPHATYSVVRVVDNGGCCTSFHVMAGLAAAKGCDVINLSLESSPQTTRFASGPQATQFACGPLCDEMVSGILATIVRDAANRDAVVVAAAGNKALNELAYPARVAEAVAVVSVNTAGDRSGFSNAGFTAHDGSAHAAVFAAPGGDSTAWGGALDERVGTDAAGTADYHGTSHAAAYASAVVALHRAANRAKDRAAIVADLVNYADASYAGYSPAIHGNGVLRLP